MSIWCICSKLGIRGPANRICLFCGKIIKKNKIYSVVRYKKKEDVQMKLWKNLELYESKIE